MTKSEVITLLNCTVIQLAEKLGISHSAVSQWEEEKIPLLREYQIRDMFSKLKPVKRKKVHTAA